MRKRILFSLMLLSFSCQANQTVRIDFSPYTIDDFDIFFRKGFESEGYTAFVNYFDRSADRPYDLLFNYEWEDNILTASLYNPEGKLVKQYKEKIIYNDRIESTTYQFLGNFLGRVIDVKDRRGRIKRSFGIVGLEISKLDSAVYALTVLGAETISMDLVQKEFLNIGAQLAGEFRTYFEGSYHLYEGGERWLPSSQLIGWKVKGVIIGADMPDQKYIQLAAPPDIYLSYYDYLAKDIVIPWTSDGTLGMSMIYIMRNSNRSADYGPNIVYLDGESVCDLDFQKYAALPVSPGWHIITVKHLGLNSEKRMEKLHLKVEPSGNAFVSIIWGFHVGIIYQEVKEYEAKILIRDLEKEDCNFSE